MNGVPFDGLRANGWGLRSGRTDGDRPGRWGLASGQLDDPKTPECVIETLNQRRQHKCGLDGAVANPERRITITSWYRPWWDPDPLEFTNFQADLHQPDPGCVNPGGQFRFVYVPEQRATSRRGGPTHQFTTRSENAIEVLLIFRHNAFQVGVPEKLPECFDEKQRRHDSCSLSRMRAVVHTAASGSVTSGGMRTAAPATSAVDARPIASRKTRMDTACEFTWGHGTPNAVL